jgi:hypothetical protein
MREEIADLQALLGAVVKHHGGVSCREEDLGAVKSTAPKLQLLKEGDRLLISVTEEEKEE